MLLTKLEKRFIMFLLGCIPVRLALVVTVILVPLHILKYMGIAFLAVALGFFTIYVGGFRKVGLETQGAPIWWNLLRPIHALLWLLAAYYAWKMEKHLVWRILLVDVCLGLVSFAIYHGVLANSK